MGIHEKYAKLLANYCLSLKAGERVLVNSTYLSEPLLIAFYAEAISLGAIPVLHSRIAETERILLENGNLEQLSFLNPLHKTGIEEFEAYLVILAPFNLKETQNVPNENRKLKQEASQPLMETYFERTGSGKLKRCICQYPVTASAQEAGMSLMEYQDFVYNACHLYADNPVDEWLKVRKEQQIIVDHLNSCSEIQYKGDGIDISFSFKNRTWINSDGKNNMPSGEVFTSPVEDSGNGTVRFSYPAIYMGNELENVQLTVENGKVTHWQADRGQEFLDHFFTIEGARYFGEIAIGTNYGIQKHTKNILFDEKIGGTVHMALGQSYMQAGGKNKSTVHWDMIADMKEAGEIYADGRKIYEKGRFLIT